jgi:hypothetical protein
MAHETVLDNGLLEAGTQPGAAIIRARPVFLEHLKQHLEALE